jgi:signal transduction histidine kinase
LNQTLEERVAERTKWLTLLHNVTRAISEAPSWDEALRVVLRRICEAEKWQVGCVYLPDRDTPDQLVATVVCSEGERFQPFRQATEEMRSARAQSLPGPVYAEGRSLWLDGQEDLLTMLPVRADAAKAVGLVAGTALPITFGDETVAVLELFSDQPHRPSEELSSLMNDVGAQIGRLLERERLTAQMADLAWREQQELLHTLHDSLGQTLTGLGMLSTALNQRLTGTDAAAADTAQQIAQQAQQALGQVRQLSKGLFPVEIDPEGLMPALRQLATTTESLHKVRVQVQGHETIPVRDPRLATQLYRIAQEAVTNVVKHAEARTISIQIGSESGVVTLRIADDGVGIRNAARKRDGMGLRIMQYRATSIGAHLTVEPRPTGGTVVTCTLREMPPPATSHTSGPGSGSVR